ncbi:MAG TPA: polysaccharide deacetylase, partial [Rariglobus sp.]
PSADKFISGYLKNAKGRSYYVIQGHPNQWDDARWAEFVKLVDYLQRNHIPVVTPTELAASLSGPRT